MEPLWQLRVDGGLYCPAPVLGPSSESANVRVDRAADCPMAAWRVLLLFCAVWTSTLHLNLGDFLTVKCCSAEKQLSPDLEECQFLTNFSDYNSTNGSSLVTEFTTVNLTEAIEDDTGNFSFVLENFLWLPEFLWNGTEETPTVIFKESLDCEDGRVVLLVSPQDENRFRWEANGSLTLRSRSTRGAEEEQLFQPDEFCADTFKGGDGVERRVILLCACARLRCISKCCLPGQALLCDDQDVCDCVKYDEEWNPLHPDLPLPEEDFFYEVAMEQNFSNHFCEDGWSLQVDAFAGYPFYMVQTFWKKLLEERNLCGDTMASTYAGARQGLVRCQRDFPFTPVPNLSHWLHLPEAVLLALALATLLLAPRRRLSVHSHVHDLAMFWHAAALLGRSLLWPPFAVRFIVKCWHVPIAIYFFSIAASFWLNVICINMIVGFWKAQGARGGGSGAARKAIVFYSVYAWGASAILTAFTAAMWYAKEVPSGWIRPTLHETRTCFREHEGQGKMASFAYYYGPIGALLLINALIFSSTAVRVRQLSSHAKVLRAKTSSNSVSSGGKDGAVRQDRSMIIYVKLLWLMGVVEMGMEIATWASNTNEFYNSLVASFIDLLRGAAIFTMCCCNRRTVRALRERAERWAAFRALRRCWRTARPSGDSMDLSGTGRPSSSTSELSYDTNTSQVTL